MIGGEYKGQVLVVRVEPQKEGDALVTLFAGELGLVRAKVVAARTMRSRLRSHLLKGSLAEVSLVEGVDFYRLKGAIDEPQSRLIIKTNQGSKVIGQILQLLEKHLHGPEPHPKLFGAIKEVFAVLKALPATQSKDQWTSRLVTAYQLILLSELGYTPALNFLPNLANTDYKTVVKSLLALDNLRAAQACWQAGVNNLP